MQRRLLGEYHPGVGWIYQKLGNLFEAKKEYEVALQYYQKSIISWTVNFANTNIYVNPSLANIAEVDIWGTLQFKAEAFAGWSQQKGGDLQTMRIAFSTFQLLTGYLDQLRSSYKTEGSKIVIGAKWNNIYSAAIKVALKLFAMTGETHYKEKAFSFAEENQAIALAQSLQESRAKQFAGIPAALIEKEQDLRAQVTFYETEIEKEEQKKEKQDKTKLLRDKDRHFVLKRDYEKLSKRLEKSYPRYYELKQRSLVASTDEIQKFLDDKTACLEYFLSDSSVFVFTLTRDGFEAVALKRDSTLNAHILTLSNSFKNVSAKTNYLQSAAQLYNFLIKPVAASIADKPRWIIIPDGELYQIPFEALLTEEVAVQANAGYVALPYLIKSHEISYHYSATLFLKSLKEKSTGSYANLFAGLAPVFDAAAKNGVIYRDDSEDSSAVSSVPQADSTFLATRDGKTLESLPYSAQEVQEILTALQGPGRLFLQQEASEENFKRQIKDYKYVHVATHGRMVAANPKLSNLTFSQPHGKTVKEDGILFSGETYNLELNADLLVLSACQTGAGQIVKGEGLIGLTRGFLYSGARNIVASLWKVYDQHTSLLMVEMYRQIAAGKSYAAALREAKLKMIANPETAAPQSWAGFVLIGR
jgi:CHAT domain-containing protein